MLDALFALPVGSRYCKSKRCHGERGARLKRKHSETWLQALPDGRSVSANKSKRCYTNARQNDERKESSIDVQKKSVPAHIATRLRYR